MGKILQFETKDQRATREKLADGVQVQITPEEAEALMNDMLSGFTDEEIDAIREELDHEADLDSN